MRSNWILFLIIVASSTIRFEGLKLVENGYEDLYIVIQETVSEDPQLLDRIQEIFRDASILLYRATHKRAYFRNLKVILPKTWTKNESYMTVPGLSAFTSHIRIGNNSMITPVTVGSEGCGQEGLYTYLNAKEFVLKRNTTRWGPHDRVIVHEWGHLRWGLKDEYPTLLRPGVGNKIVRNNDGGSVLQTGEDTLVASFSDTVYFFQADGKWNPVGCSRDLLGFASTTCKGELPEGKCDTYNLNTVIEADCKFCPSMTQPFNASIMGFQFITSIVEFCDKDDPETPFYMRHDSRATNEQNDRCDGKSSWEVMREHEDFKNGSNPPLQDELPPTPNFEFFQTLSGKVRVFVLDTSGSMHGDRIIKLFNAAKFTIETLLPLGSWLGLVDFDHVAVLLSTEGIVHIDSDTRRQELVSVLPQEGSGGTCIACGLNLGLSLLENFTNLDSIKEAEMILISDGLDGYGGLELATQRCVNAGVVVHSISVTEAADRRLIDIATQTGGKVFFFSELGVTSLAAMLSEVITSGATIDALAPVTIYNEKIISSQNVPVTIPFNVDDGIGQDIRVSVISETVCDLDIAVTGPNSLLQTNAASNVTTLSLLIIGISEKGEYAVNVTSSVSSNFEVIVTSKPLSMDTEVIRPFVRLSSNNLVFTGSALPAIYAHLRKGESPIKKAIVKTMVENEQGNKTCELILLDDGLGVDIKAGDGVYSAVLLRECQSGNGRHSSKIIISGTGETKVTNYVESGSAIIDAETTVTTETPTGRFERMAVGDSYTVSNFTITAANEDITAPGKITDVRVIDINSETPATGSTKNYTITWIATGDDVNVGQASYYEMRISNDRNVLIHDFLNAQLLNVSGAIMAPNVSGKVERLVIEVSSNKDFRYTTYFAIVAVDEAGNRGPVSNIIPITIGLESQFKVIEEECTDNCYAVVKDCGRSLIVANGQVNFSNTLTKAGNSVPVICDKGFKLIGGSSIECLENGIWSTNVTCQIVGDAETMTFKTVTIIGSSVGLLFLVVIGFLLHTVIKQTKLRTAEKGFRRGVRKKTQRRRRRGVWKNIYMSEEDYIEANPDYETDSQVWCTHGLRSFKENKLYADEYQMPREPYEKSYLNENMYY